MVPTPCIIIAADVVGSTGVKSSHGNHLGVNMVVEELDKFRAALLVADDSLTQAMPYAGDSILLVDGVNAVGLYRAVKIFQAVFRSFPDNRLPLRVSMHFGEYQTVEKDGIKSLHGIDLDMVCHINALCPPGRVVVSQALYYMLDEAGFGNRFYKRRGQIKGRHWMTYYLSNGEYKPPRTSWVNSQWNPLPQTYGQLIGVISALITIVTMVWMLLA